MSEYRRYDHRVKNLIAETGDIHMFPELNIPDSTKRQWVKNGPIEVVTCPTLDHAPDHLIKSNQILTQQVEAL